MTATRAPEHDLLASLVALHRALFRDELRIRLTVHRVPADTEPIPVGEGTVDVTDSGPLGGAPLSIPMNRRLGALSGYGALYPWAHSWSFLRRACRNDHPGHTARGEFGGALCWQVVSWAIISEYEPATIAGILRIPVEHVERHLRNALGWIEEDMDRKQRFRNSRDPQPSEEPTPSRLSLLRCDAVTRATEDFDLQQRIWEGQVGIMRSKLADDQDIWDLVSDPAPHYVKLTREEWERLWSWDREWGRRQQALLVHRQECDRCRRVA